MKNIMTHLVYGYPTITQSRDLFDILSQYSRFIEIQIPFSDPIADGAIISHANTIALQQKIQTDHIFEFISSRKRTSKSSILIMCYYHSVFHYWPELFIQNAAKSWIYGIIVPDIPLDEEEWKYLYELCQKYWIYFIVTVSPNCSVSRLRFLSSHASWFLYAISQNMTTGALWVFSEEFEEYMKKLRYFFHIPIGVGFWIGSKETVDTVNSIADFSIVGSKIVSLMNIWGVGAVEDFLKTLKFYHK